VRKEYVLDANAVLIYLEDRSGADRMRLVADDPRLHDVILEQVMRQLPRRIRDHEIGHAIEELQPLRKGIDLLPADLAALFKYKYRIGYADGFAAALATTNRATLVTSDPDFDILEPRIRILRLPHHSS